MLCLRLLPSVNGVSVFRPIKHSNREGTVETAIPGANGWVHAHCKKRIVILTTVVCYLVVDDNTLHAWTQLIAKMV